MESTLGNLLAGFAAAATPETLLYAVVGCVTGTIVGVLPGIGPLVGISVLLPATYGLDITQALVVLAGVYYGAMYGGAITSILLNIPGDAAAIVTCIDGAPMAKNGRPGVALATAALSSFTGGTISIIWLMLLAPPLARLALQFGPAEYFSLIFFGLIVLCYTGGKLFKSLAMILLGLILGLISIDHMTGYYRMTFGIVHFGDGLDIVAVAVGMFGISEILATAGKRHNEKLLVPKLRELFPTRQDLRLAAPAIGRGHIIGFFFGLIPGAAHIISTFMAYAVERRVAKDTSQFGKGAIQGLAAPESANNSATVSTFIPMLAMGLPTGAIPAILLAAVMIHGIKPGPLFITEHALTFWTLIASMYIGNIILLILNIPMVGLFVNILRIPYHILYPAILVFSIIGCYGPKGSYIEVLVMAFMGVLAYVLRKLELEAAPVILGLLLSPTLEFNFRQGLALSNGSFAIFVERPISLFFLCSAALMFCLSIRGYYKKRPQTQ